MRETRTIFESPWVIALAAFVFAIALSREAAAESREPTVEHLAVAVDVPTFQRERVDNARWSKSGQHLEYPSVN